MVSPASSTDGRKRKIVERDDSVPFEATVAVSMGTTQSALCFKYVKLNDATPCESVVSNRGTPPASEFWGVRFLSLSSTIKPDSEEHMLEEIALSLLDNKPRQPSSSASSDPFAFLSSEQNVFCTEHEDPVLNANGRILSVTSAPATGLLFASVTSTE